MVGLVCIIYMRFYVCYTSLIFWLFADVLDGLSMYGKIVYSDFILTWLKVLGKTKIELRRKHKRNIYF